MESARCSEQGGRSAAFRSSPCGSGDGGFGYFGFGDQADLVIHSLGNSDMDAGVDVEELYYFVMELVTRTLNPSVSLQALMLGARERNSLRRLTVSY